MFKNLSRKDILFVSVQAILFGLYAFPCSGVPLVGEVPRVIRTAGFILAAVGVLIVLLSMLQMKRSLSPFPSPKDSASLVVHGMFKYLRHPIYSGILLSAYSWSLVSDSALRVLISIALHVLFYFKSRYEERLLTERYEGYSEYQRTVGRFVPRFW